MVVICDEYNSTDDTWKRITKQSILKILNVSLKQAKQPQNQSRDRDTWKVFNYSFTKLSKSNSSFKGKEHNQYEPRNQGKTSGQCSFSQYVFVLRETGYYK